METQSHSNGVKNKLFDNPLESVFEELNVDPAKGLCGNEVAKRLAQTGYNEVIETNANPILRFAGKFWGISAWMLELVVILSWYLQKYPDMAIVAGSRGKGGFEWLLLGSVAQALVAHSDIPVLIAK